MHIEVLIPFLIILPAFGVLVVIIVLAVSGTKQHLTNNISGHNVEVVTGYGYAQLIIDGKVVDEIRSWYMYTAKLQGLLCEVPIVVNIGTGFCRYRITTFINGNKDEVLSN